MGPDLFATNLERFGERIAVITDRGERLTYVELAALADQFAARLDSQRRVVAIEGSNTIPSLAAYLGAIRAGHVALLLAGGGQSEILAKYRPDYQYAPVGGDYVLNDVRGNLRDLHPDLALLLSTSGTTGSAKLVRLSAAAVQANAVSIATYLQLTGEDRPITSLPMHYSYGLSVINSHLLVGATLLLTGASAIEPAFWSFLDGESATSLAGVPYTYELLERIGFRDQTHSSLRTLTQAGGRLPRDLVLAYGGWAAATGGRFFVMYGQTEATARMAYLPPELVLEKPESIGVAIPDGRFSLVDDRGRIIEGAGVPGELAYSGPNVMMGYAERAEDLARGSETSELRTGDLAERDEQGVYRIVGRKSRFAKVFGLRISLDDVEKQLRQDGVRAAACSDDAIIAVAALAPAVASEVQEKLGGHFKLPAETFVVRTYDELPILPSGKVDYRTILGEAKSQAGHAPALASIPQRIDEAFHRAFRQGVQPQDSFIELGGDSLNYVMLSLALEDALGFLPPDWEHRSLSELQSMAPKPKPSSAFTLRAMDSEIALRALAIMAVVVLHVSNLVVGGGSQVLLMLAGYNMARYQRSALVANEGGKVLASFGLRILAPYYLLLSIYLIIKRELDIPSLLLVSNYFGRRRSLIEPFWFIEALLQCTVIVVALMAIPAVRRFADRRPWEFGLALLAPALVVKALVASSFETEHLLSRTADAVFFLIAFGWCLQQATTLKRRLVVSALAVGFASLEVAHVRAWPALPPPSDMARAVWLLTSVLTIAWAPRIVVPGLLRQGLTVVAAASFYIYLTHVITVEILYWTLHLTNIPLNLSVALAVGILTWRLLKPETFTPRSLATLSLRRPS